MPRGEVGRIYQSADCFILPTLSDGYALTQLEALAHGMPVIASKRCGEAVAHGRNGWILEDLEPGTIATVIRVAMTEGLSDVRPPEFSLDDLAEALIRQKAGCLPVRSTRWRATAGSACEWGAKELPNTESAGLFLDSPFSLHSLLPRRCSAT